MSSLTSWLGRTDRRILVLIAALLVVVLTAGTLGGVYAYRQSLPTTVGFNLRPDQSEVPLDQALVVSFSRPVTGAAAHIRVAPAAEGRLAAAADQRSFTWTPSAPWSDLTTYTVSVDPFEDGGHAVRGARLRFTTTILPRVTGVSLEGGGGLADGASIPAGSKLLLAFNAAMDQQALQLTANGAPARLAWASDSRSAALDTHGMKVGPLDLAIAAGRDGAGHPMAPGWKLGLDLVFTINVHTTPLRYPALVQIPNDPTARDQSGLQSADIVFEYATEGNIPRFTAVFTSVPDKVGPVRSGRLISIKLTQHYRGMLFLSGTSQGTGGVLRQSGIPAFFDAAGYYYRSPDRRAPNNLYISGDAIARAEGQTSIAAYRLPTGRPNLPAGPGGTQVQVAQNGSTYGFDDTTRTYTKSEDGHTFSDASLGQPLHISMLVVMHTAVTVTGIIEDSNNAHGLDYDLSSGGPAEIYSDGQKAAGRWSAPDGPGSPLVLTLPGGQRVPMPAGLTWIDVVP